MRNDKTNTVKLQGTKSTYKNLLHFYMLKMSQQKKKLRKQSHLQSQQKEQKIPRNKFNQGGERPVH